MRFRNLLMGAMVAIGAMLEPATREARTDAAQQLAFAATGSLQNPAWSPDSDAIVLTRFRGGYNIEPADLLIGDLGTLEVSTLVADGSGNINLPGSTWNESVEAIVFSSSRDPHDEIFLIDDAGLTGEVQVTKRPNDVAYEPSLSPDGLWVVFESHLFEVEVNGVIVKLEVGASGPYTVLTGLADDCRQPNWSPTGDRIVYQRLVGGRWDLWVVEPSGDGHLQLTAGPGDSTDASFSPDGRWIVYSYGDVDLADIYVRPVAGGTPIRVTSDAAYDGAPSWSPDGRWIAFESSPGDPDDSPGTTLWRIKAPLVFADGFESGETSRWSESLGIGSGLEFRSKTYGAGVD